MAEPTGGATRKHGAEGTATLDQTSPRAVSYIAGVPGDNRADREDAATLGDTVVTSAPGGFGERLAAALDVRGVTTRLVVTSGTESREHLAMAFRGEDRVSAVVHAHIDPLMLQIGNLDTLDDAAWDARCEAQLRHSLHCLQAAFDVFDFGTVHRLVSITPTIAMIGAPGLVPASTAFEGLRALTKSAGRQWGARGCTANCVAPPLELLDADAPSTPAVAVPSLPETADPIGGVASVVRSLLGPAGMNLNGQTLTVDRGTVMV